MGLRCECLEAVFDGLCKGGIGGVNNGVLLVSGTVIPVREEMRD